MGRWVGQKKTKLMLYSTLVEIEVEVGVELGNTVIVIRISGLPTNGPWVLHRNLGCHLGRSEMVIRLGV